LRIQDSDFRIEHSSFCIPHPSSFTKGFTLLEILVVMFIIGIVVTIVAVNYSRDPREILKTEAEQLSLLLQQARDDAIISATTLAWKSEGDAHAFFKLEADGKWQPIEKDENFSVRRWPPQVRIANARINGVKTATNEALIFYPSGFNPPFELTLALENSRLVIAGDALSRIRIDAGTDQKR
jgi:general secretion pathway protein H